MLAKQFKLFDIDELLAFPSPSWLIADKIPEGAFAMLHGQPGEGKSFLALNWSLSCAAGLIQPDSAPRTVVYIVGEGGSGFRNRVDAWMTHHGVREKPPAFFVKEPVQFREQREQDALLAAFAQMPNKPDLLVIDTFANCFQGGEENSARDVGEFIGGVKRVQGATGTAVLLLHHSGKSKGNKSIERGSSALRGAIDVAMHLEKKDNLLILTNTKQKDAAPFEPAQFAFQSVRLMDDPNTGLPRSSMVATPADALVAPVIAPFPRGPGLADRSLRILKSLADVDGPVSYTTWVKSATDSLKISGATFERDRKALDAAGLIAFQDGLYRPAA